VNPRRRKSSLFTPWNADQWWNSWRSRSFQILGLRRGILQKVRKLGINRSFSSSRGIRLPVAFQLGSRGKVASWSSSYVVRGHVSVHTYIQKNMHSDIRGGGLTISNASAIGSGSGLAMRRLTWILAMREDAWATTRNSGKPLKDSLWDKCNIW
jgi:hypothetical protein